MPNKEKKYKWFFINVALFAIYPVLYVFVYNQQHLDLRDILMPLLIVEVIVWIVWLTVFVILKNVKQTSFITSLSVILFFSFNFIRTITLKSTSISYDLSGLLVLSAYALFPLIFFLGIYISDKKLTKINNFLNITAIILCAFSIYNIVSYQVKAGINDEQQIVVTQTTAAPEILPDIYYIVTDAHARSDILEEIYDIDNSDFINFLKDKGFYVAEKSYTNYPRTILSLSSSLNMEYHDGYDRRLMDISPIKKIFKYNTFQQLVESLGYKTYNFATGLPTVERKNVDYYLSPKGVLNNFHMSIIKMTPLLNIPIRLINYTVFNSRRSRILYTFKNLPEVSKAPGPKFVIAHIIAPHYPFIFKKDGSLVENETAFLLLNEFNINDENSRQEYINSYGEQLKFVDLKLKESITKILENATRPSIIILQADHGPMSHYRTNSLEGSYLKEKFAILNAYYFFDKKYNSLYQSISPVNTFRLISNQYFDKEYKLLEDKSFNTLQSHPYFFQEITDSLEDKLLNNFNEKY